MKFLLDNWLLIAAALVSGGMLLWPKLRAGNSAGRAVGILRKLGFENARALGGGLKAWRDATLPTEKSA